MSKPNMEMTKHDQTTSEPYGCLPRGDALVAYENRKQEKKCAGKKNGCEIMCDIKVVSA
jgi:hypothetical protein